MWLYMFYKSIFFLKRNLLGNRGGRYRVQISQLGIASSPDVASPKILFILKSELHLDSE